MPKMIDHNPGECPDLVPPLKAATETMVAKIKEMPGEPHVVFVMVAVDVSNPMHMDNVRMVSNMQPKAAMELLGFITEGTLRQMGPAEKFTIPHDTKH
jgi:hypothetical protein